MQEDFFLGCLFVAWPFSLHISFSWVRIRLHTVVVGSTAFFGHRNSVLGWSWVCDNLYICEQLSSETSELEYEEIYNGNIDEQIKVFRMFEQILK